MRRSEGPAAGPGYPCSRSRMGLPGGRKGHHVIDDALWEVIGAGLQLTEKSGQGQSLALPQLHEGEMVGRGPSRGHLLAHRMSGGGIQRGCCFQKRTEKSKNGKSASSRHHAHPSPSPVAHACTLKQSWGCKSTFSKTYHCGGRRELGSRALGPSPAHPGPREAVSPPLTLEPWHWGRLRKGYASPASGRGRRPASVGSGVSGP